MTDDGANGATYEVAPVQTGNEKTIQAKRRLSRHKENIFSILGGLPSPFGAHAPSKYADLSIWGEILADGEPGTQPIDWNMVPPSCEPASLLSNPENKGKKHGKTVLEQIDMVKYDRPPPGKEDKRGLQKRWQVESFLLVLRQLLDSNYRLHIVDFGCGTGALLLPLAFLFPKCQFTGVEMKPAALAILNQRAAAAGLTNVSTFVGMIENFEEPFDVALALHACGNATDLTMLKAEQHRAAYICSPCCVGKLKFSLQGGTSFGNQQMEWRWMPRMAGSDEHVQEAGQRLLAAATSAFSDAHEPPKDEHEQLKDSVAISAPCRLRPVVPHPLRPLRHPRSDALLNVLPEPVDQNFKLLAQVADTNYQMNNVSQAVSHQNELLSTLSATLEKVKLQQGEKFVVPPPPPQLPEVDDLARKAAYCALAKLHVELDRNEAAREAGYAVGIFRMLNAGSMAKGDLLVGLPAESKEWAHVMHLLEGPSVTLCEKEREKHERNRDL